MEPTINSYPNPPQKSSKISPVVIVVVVLLIAVIGTILITRQPKKTEETKEVVITQAVPTPTEKPKIDKLTVKIQVVNGTGTPGQAGEVVKALKEAGYSADNIKTGNAENFDNTTTSIAVKTNFEEIANDIRDVLKPTFSETTVKSSNLDKENEFDVVIVTGGKIFATVTPTGSQTPTPTTQLTTTPSPTPSLTLTPTLTPTPTP